MSARSMQLLLPTIRKPGSELWFTWNPELPTDPIDQLLRPQDAEGKPLPPPEGAIVVHANFTDNPFCPQVLRDEAKRMHRVDPDAYAHVWLGTYNKRSKAQVLAGKWRVDEFTPAADWQGPYQGADFGFAQDPTALLRSWTHARTLYIEYESYAVGLELDHTAARWRTDVPGSEKYVTRADNARPESISYLKRHGFPRIEGVEKWKGSVEDGIAFLRQFDRIVIHPRCVHTAEEARLWSYKVDKQTGDVLPDVVDAHNHCWDSERYALAPLIKATPPMRAWVF
jgi:phage terminase large subunit